MHQSLSLQVELRGIVWKKFSKILGILLVFTFRASALIRTCILSWFINEDLKVLSRHNVVRWISFSSLHAWGNLKKCRRQKQSVCVVIFTNSKLLICEYLLRFELLEFFLFHPQEVHCTWWQRTVIHVCQYTYTVLYSQKHMHSHT